jgi:thioesterase domain-containing protein
VYCFGALARELGDDRPFLAFQSPGLDRDAAAFESIEAMAASYAAAVVAERPEGPIHLGGWSLGGLVAFEMARQLSKAGREVATLAVFDAPAPTATPPKAPAALKTIAREAAALELLGPADPAADPEEDAFVLAEFAGGLARDFGGDAPRLLERLKALEPDARREYLLRYFKLDQVYALETGPDRVNRLWNVLRSNLRAAVRYRPGAYNGHMVVCRARDGAGRPAGEPTLGWRRLVKQGVTCVAIAGDHAGILKPPAVATLAERLRAELERGDAR